MNLRLTLSTFLAFSLAFAVTAAFSAQAPKQAPKAPDQKTSAACPEVSKVQSMINRTFRKSIKVKKVQPARVDGLCRVEITFQNRNRVLYVDSKGTYIIPGDVYRTSDGTNLTREAMMEINRFTEPQMKTLEKLTAFAIGEKGPVVYFVTDPQCPYCKKAEAILEPLAQSGQLQVRVLLYPLKFHKGAKEECISIICDNKGLEGLKSRYRSENQCDHGKKLIKDTVKFLQSKGITGTPTYIFPDGRFQSGVLQKDKLLKKIGVSAGAEKQSKPTGKK